jgi:hypothetical protein
MSWAVNEKQEAVRADMRALLVIRLIVASGLLLTAILSAFGFFWELPLTLSLVVMGLFVSAQALGGYKWALGYLRSPPRDPKSGEPNPYADAAKVMLTTQGVVLGLVSFSGDGKLSLVVKIGSSSLAAGVLVASALYMLVASSPPPESEDGSYAFAGALLFSLSIWSLAFGLICIVAGNWSIS